MTGAASPDAVNANGPALPGSQLSGERCRAGAAHAYGPLPFSFGCIRDIWGRKERPRSPSTGGVARDPQACGSAAFELSRDTIGCSTEARTSVAQRTHVRR